MKTWSKTFFESQPIIYFYSQPNCNMKKELISSSFILFFFFARSQHDSLRITDLQDSATNYNFPVFSMGGGDAESDLGEQDVSSLLQSSRDLYTQFAGSQFGTAQFRMRGYSAENQMVMINGVNVNDPERGFASWSSWGGLNDVTRYTEMRYGLGPNRYGFSGPGGYINIDSKASSFKKGTQSSFAGGNRIFRSRLMLTHSTGLNSRNWAFTFSLSYRRGNEVYIPGTYFDAKSFYFSIDKKIKDKHLFSLTSFWAPTEKGLSAAATAEAYDISGTHYYNDAWGYQNGKVRNASVSKANRPMFLFSHVYTPDQKRRVSSSIYYAFGKDGLTGLNFNNAPNPKPDYYKYMPSYFYNSGDISGGDAALLSWQTDANTKQINWDHLIAMNQANLYSDPASPGQINTQSSRARYIVEDRITDHRDLGFNTVFNERKENLFLSLGLNAYAHSSHNYKQMQDLLGATFWIDVDQFAQNLGVDPMIQQNDIEHPNRKIVKDDKFGYDYRININHAEMWASVEYTFKKMDFYMSCSFSDNAMWRTGYMANGKFPLTSKGESTKLNFLNYGFRAGSTYKLNGRNYITGNIQVQSRAPQAANVFVSPRVRNDVVDNVKSEELVSGDLNYIAKYPGLKLRVTLYSTQINNRTWLRTYYDDNYNTLVDLVMTDVNQIYRGFEFGVEKIFWISHSLQLVSGFAQSYYSNNPKLQAWQDNTNTPLYYNRRSYLKNYRLGSSPQFVSAISYRFTGRKRWSAGLGLNYFSEIYVEPNPDRRTEETVGKFQTGEEQQVKQITGQEKLPAYFTLNATISKSFKIRKIYTLTMNGSVNNILNNKNCIVSGYEQLRWDQQDLSRFPNKYTYMGGITYLVILQFNF